MSADQPSSWLGRRAAAIGAKFREAGHASVRGRRSRHRPVSRVFLDAAGDDAEFAVRRCSLQLEGLLSTGCHPDLHFIGRRQVNGWLTMQARHKRPVLVTRGLPIRHVGQVLSLRRSEGDPKRLLKSPQRSGAHEVNLVRSRGGYPVHRWCGSINCLARASRKPHRGSAADWLLGQQLCRQHISGCWAVLPALRRTDPCFAIGVPCRRSSQGDSRVARSRP